MADTSGFDPVPWFVADGALHSADVLRSFAYAATGSAEGIVSAKDLKVTALATPGNGVNIGPGAAIVLNRSAGADRQSYAMRAPALSRLDVPATGSGSGQSYLVVIRVEDPQYAPWAAYPTADQKKVGPYVFPRLIPCPPGTVHHSQLGLPHSMLSLARIDMPASTAAVQQSYIKDLRGMVQPRQERIIRMYRPGDIQYLSNTNATYAQFPFTAEVVPCPSWATKLQMVVTAGNMLIENTFTGGIRAEYGWNGVDPYLFTPPSGLHHVDNSSERITVVMAETFDVPAAFRGKSHYVRTGSYGNANSTGRIIQDTWMNVIVDMEFIERPE